MPGSKRAIETVDLTGDSDGNNSSHRVKKGKAHAQHTSSSQGRSYLTPPASSSQPGSSQPGHRVSGHPGSNQSIYSSSYGQSHSQRDRDNWLASTQAQEDDIRREIDLEEDFDDDVYANYQLYGILNTRIVGCRFYGGRCVVGEYVKVRREPGNPYDTNAIRIDNVMAEQIGHIGRDVAAKLAPLMDSTQLLVEGALTGPKAFYDCPIGLKLFGTTDPVASAALKQKMIELRLPVIELNRAEKEREKRRKAMEQQRKAREKAAAAMRKNGNSVFDQEGPNRYSNLGMPDGTGQQQPDLEELLGNTATCNPRDMQDVMNRFVASEEALFKMPMADQPPAIATTLLPYQRQGLKWMIDHESPKLPTNSNGDDVVQMWKYSHGLYSNIATSFSVTQPPKLASGGILADDMGLGKTLQVLSLVVADPHKSKEPTLVIAPLSVMSNWANQASLHVKKQFAPRVLTYHGQESRWLTPEQFQEYDLVITTYQTMTQELFPYGKNKAEKVPAKRGLFAVNWRRVVQDEGHNTRNPKSKMSIAASTLMAKSRWILTGTPIVNSLKDLYSHVKFLKMSGGLAEFDIFNGTLIRPLKNNDPNARILLQALMSTLCLRRMKDMAFVDLKLPAITFHKYPIKLLSHEQERYDAFKSEAKGLLEAAKAKKSNDGRTMTHLLEVLLRLRQTCNHWKLPGEARLARIMELVEENKAIDVTNTANRRALQDLLQIKMDSQEECPVCMDSMKAPMITACAHAFCQECIEKVIETQHKCPMCRADLPNVELLVTPAADAGEGDEEVEIDVETTSSKIEALVKILKSTKKGEKTVVFSQWTSFLDLVQTQLLENGLTFTRLDGKMNATKRDAAITSLNTDPDCQILLASLSMCSVGLNLVAANQVILSDSWWAPAIEDQAVDRVHRLGQTKPCRVLRLTTEDTIEDEVLEIQAKKRKLAGMAFGEKEGQRNRKEMRAGTLSDIAKLLGA